MTEHKICKGCRWNKYPLCEGTVMNNGKFMNIENLEKGFECGQKDNLEVSDLIPKKTELELRIDALEERINTLEELSK